MNDRIEARDIEEAFRIADHTMEIEHGRNSVHAHGFKKSSSDRTAKLKSLAGYTDAYIEEAEEVGEAEFQQLDDSLRVEGSQIHLMLNSPAKSHWIIKRWFNLAWKRNKGAVEEDDHLGIEDPKCPNHLMSAARYFLMEMVKANADPEAEARERERAQREVHTTSDRLTQNQSR